MDRCLERCVAAVAAAGEVCRDIQRRLVSADTLVKADRSPVTIADFASQAVVCALLRRRYPHIPVVAEEDSGELKKAEHRGLLEKVAAQLPGWSPGEILAAIDWGGGRPGPLFFTLDPIDGTKGFLRGEQYAVALALVREGQVALGALACPNLHAPGREAHAPGTIVYAERGRGAFGRPMAEGEAGRLRVSDVDEKAGVRFLTSVESGHSDHGRQAEIMAAFGEGRRTVPMDSQAKYAVLAAGRADVYLRLPSPKTPDYREKIWDHAAGAIVVHEAGGRVTDVRGRALDFAAGRKLANNSGVVGSNGRLHDAILRAVDPERPPSG